MLKIRFVILLGILLGSVLSVAAVKARPAAPEKSVANRETGRNVSSEN